MIAKCQRSLETTEPTGPQLMIYNRTREWVWVGPIPPDWNAQFGPTTADEDNRFFAEVKWGEQWGKGPPLFVRKVPEQNWPYRGDVWLTPPVSEPEGNDRG